MRHTLSAIRLVLLTFLSLLLALPPTFAWAEDAGLPKRTVRLAIISDVHYVDPAGIPAAGTKGRAAFERAESAEIRIIDKIDSVLTKALDGVVASSPDALLVSGDLASNGEYANAQKFASRLKETKGKLGGVGVYVVNGNHDMNMSYAANYTNEGIEATRRINQQDWRTIFDGLDYGGGEGFSYFADANPSAASATDEVKNSGGLSYVTEVTEGVTLITLDTALYSKNEKAQFNQAQRTPGSVSPELLAWATAQAKAAKAKGNLVLVMTHHAMLPHYTERNESIDSYMEQFVIPNWKQMADTLADAGVTAYISGHTHSNDIAKYVTAAGNTIYDINTAGLCAYPCAWRTVDISIIGTGADATYDFDINTNYITSTDGTDDFQTHAYNKCSLIRQNIEPIFDYMIRLTLSDIKNFAEAPYGEGLAGFINKALDIYPRGAEGSVGNLATAKLKEQLEKTDVRQDTGTLGVLTVKYKDTDVSGNVIRLNVSLARGSSSPSTGVLSIDLNGIPAAIDSLVAEISAKYVETVGDNGMYATSALQKDLNSFVTSIVLDVDKQPLDAQDANSNLLNILNEAYQAFMHGDEHSFVWPGLKIGSAAELAQRRVAWNGLLSGDAFVSRTRTAALEQLKKLTDKSAYPTIADLLSRASFVPSATGGKGDWFIKFDVDSPGLFNPLSLVAGKFNGIKTAADLIETIESFASSLNPISADFVKNSLSVPLANMQHSFTIDNNIPNDTTWKFHSVLFDACGGTAIPSSDLTVENGRLGRTTIGLALPTPTREGRTSLGWFTAKEGGQAIDANADFTNVRRIYAHWNPVKEVEYLCVAGNGATWRHETQKPLEFTFARSEDNDQALSHFTGILIDGKDIEEENYDTRAGGVVVSLKPRFLASLANAPHTLTACFDDGNDPQATFTLVSAGDEAQGDQEPDRGGHVPTSPSYYDDSSDSDDYYYVETDASGSGTHTSSGTTDSRVSRIAGSTRYDTMASIISSSFPSSSWVVIASGESYADALSATAVAGAHHAPVALTAKDSLTPQAREQIVRLGSTHAIIVGGPGAVSDAVEASLRELVADTTRIFGADRTATSVAAMRAARTASSTSDTVVLTTGYAFADALSIGSWSYASVSPIILTGADGMLSDEAVRAIREDSGIKNVVIVGGTNAVAEAVTDQLGTNYSFERLGGADRISTSALVANFGAAHGLKWSCPFVASGLGFADALAGAAAAGSNGSPLLLVTSPEGATIEALREARSQISEVKVVGGPTAVSEATFGAIGSAIK